MSPRVRLIEGVLDVARAGLAQQLVDPALQQHAPLMQHGDLISRLHLVDQVRRPEHADAALATAVAHLLQNALAAVDIEADGGLVGQQQARLVQQGAGQFQAPALAAAELAHLLVGAVGEADAQQGLGDARPCTLRVEPLQGAEVTQVLPRRQIQVQGRLLEHHADVRQGAGTIVAEIAPENANAALATQEQARDQREQRRLAGAVDARAARRRRRHSTRSDTASSTLRWP